MAVPCRWQTKWDDIPGSSCCLFHHQQCDVIIEPNTTEPRMCTYLYHLVCLWWWRLIITLQVDIAQPHCKLTWAEPESENTLCCVIMINVTGASLNKWFLETVFWIYFMEYSLIVQRVKLYGKNLRQTQETAFWPCTVSSGQAHY
jgi:hypothetical protein